MCISIEITEDKKEFIEWIKKQGFDIDWNYQIDVRLHINGRWEINFMSKSDKGAWMRGFFYLQEGSSCIYETEEELIGYTEEVDICKNS